MAGFENSAGIGVSAFYGPMSTREGIEGSKRTEGTVQELSLVIQGKNINDDVFGRNLAYLPAGASIQRVIVDVKEAFTLGGTTPTILVGTDGSEATNGFSISEAQAEAEGIYVIASMNGTWGAKLAAATQVSVALGGTTPTVADDGYLTLVIRYYVL